MTENENKMLLECRHMCTICPHYNVYAEIHHIDGDRDNDDLDNLTVLCRMHHEKAQIDLQIKNSMSRKLKPEHLRHYRDNHIKRCKNFMEPNIIMEKEEIEQEIIEDLKEIIIDLGWIK